MLAILDGKAEVSMSPTAHQMHQTEFLKFDEVNLCGTKGNSGQKEIRSPVSFINIQFLNKLS